MVSNHSHTNAEPVSIAEQRDALRAHMLTKRKIIPSGQREECAKKIVHVLSLAQEEHKLSLKGRIVGCYLPIAGEVETLPLLHYIEEQGGQICLPVTEGLVMQFAKWHIGEELVSGPLKIMQPAEPHSLVSPDILFVPALAVDRNGFRIGYGKGMYDRWIAEQDYKPISIAVVYSMQVVPSALPQPHDRAMDYILTPDHFFKI